MVLSFKKFPNFYILKIPLGKEINKFIEKFCQKEAQNGGFFIGLGAVKEAILAYYNVDKKKYIQKKFKKPLEIANITGNVCYFKKEVFVHSHATFADKNFKTIAGHLVEAKVVGACEIIFFPFPKKIKKVYNRKTGLKLMEV